MSDGVEKFKMMCLNCNKRGGTFYSTTKPGEFSFVCPYVFSCPTAGKVNGVLVDEELKNEYEANHMLAKHGGGR